MGSSRRPDPAEMAELLDNVRRLRLTLTVDLATAASALEAEAPEVARDIIGADCLEVRQLAAATSPPRQTAPRRRRRALLALPAIPLVGALAMTGAAALSGHIGGSVSAPHHQVATSAPSARQTPGEISETAATTLRQLARVVDSHPRQSQVVAVADHLHDQLSALLATSPHSASRIGEVQHLLSIEQELLETHRGPGATIALAAARRLTHFIDVTVVLTAPPTHAAPVLLPPTTSRPPSSKPTATTTSAPKPTTSKTPASAPLPTPKASDSRPHRHHQHHHRRNPLLGPGLITAGLLGN